MEKENKVYRVLQLYDKLRKGFPIQKRELAMELGVNERTIQRDIDNLRLYISNYFPGQEIIYDYDQKGYYLIGAKANGISSKELLGISKILLESRALNLDEMEGIIHTLLNQSDKENAKIIHSIVSNELHHYQPLEHNRPLLQMIWDIGVMIKKKQMLEIVYERMDRQETVRTVKPISIMFSEYYFYLIAFIKNTEYQSPAIFRIDRIKQYKKLRSKFTLLERNRFEEGVLRKQIQFMYSGDLIRLQFKFFGITVTPALDRFPNATILEEIENGWFIEAEVYGKGCMMWLLSQGNKVEIVSPISLRDEIKQMIESMLEIYKD